MWPGRELEKLELREADPMDARIPSALPDRQIKRSVLDLLVEVQPLGSQPKRSKHEERNDG
eukprot:scaffold405_cov243-Pinguiococcus_pyrenoidosus.AAC.11